MEPEPPVRTSPWKRGQFDQLFVALTGDTTAKPDGVELSMRERAYSAEDPADLVVTPVLDCETLERLEFAPFTREEWRTAGDYALSASMIPPDYEPEGIAPTDPGINDYFLSGRLFGNPQQARAFVDTVLGLVSPCGSWSISWTQNDGSAVASDHTLSGANGVGDHATTWGETVVRQSEGDTVTEQWAILERDNIVLMAEHVRLRVQPSSAGGPAAPAYRPPGRRTGNSAQSSGSNRGGGPLAVDEDRERLGGNLVEPANVQRLDLAGGQQLVHEGAADAEALRSLDD